MALSLKKQIEKAEAGYHKAWDAIAKAAPLDTIPFNKCYSDHASPEQRAAYDEARRKLDSLEAEAVHKGKAWRSGCLLYWYR